MWGAVFLIAVVGTASADFVFPEDVRTPGSRIVSGVESKRGQFPFQLSLRMVSPSGGVTSCGGTIISSRWGLTAAHCTVGRVTLVLRFGTTNLTQPANMFESHTYYNHPLFNEALGNIVQPNDVGLIDFEREVSFGELIQPIRLQRSSAMNQNYAGKQAIASGWGRTWTDGSATEKLNWVYLSITSNDECLEAYGGSSIIVDSTICTVGYNDPTQSTCQGDSGGPLTVIDDDGAISQVGVTSFVSRFGCHAGLPAGFVRPGHYHRWYTQVTGIDFDWEIDVSTDAPEEPEPVEPTTEEAPEVPEPVEPTTEEAPEVPEPVEPTTEEAPEVPEPVEPTTEEAPEEPEPVYLY